MSRASSRRPPDELPDGPPAPAVIQALLVAAHAIQRFTGTCIARCTFPAKLSGSRLRVLCAVDEAGSLRMGDLATKLGVAGPTITDLVDGLEKEGLLRRRPDPTDRRATLLDLSPEAHAQFERVRALQREMSEAILAPLDAGQRRQLLELLTLLKEGPLRGAAEGPWACEDE